MADDDFVVTGPAEETPPAVATPPADAGTPDVPDVADPSPAPVELPSDPKDDQARAKADRAFAALRRDRERLAAENAALKAQLPQASPPAPAPAPVTGLLPADDYPSHEAYVAAVAADAAAKALAQDKAAQAAAALAESWQAREAAAREAHADYDTVIAALQTPFHPAVLSEIQASDQGAELAYYLASHPAEAEALAALPPARALTALGRLEARLEPKAVQPSTPTPTPPTPKPHPLTPLTAASVVDTRPPDQLPYEEYVEWYKRTYGGR